MKSGRPSYASIVTTYIAKVSEDLGITRWQPLDFFFKKIDSHGCNFQEAEMGRDYFSQFAKLFALSVGYPFCW